jgi:hypothetical protein
MPDSGKHHCNAVVVGCFDDLIIPHRPAGLNDSGCTRLDRFQQAVSERKKCVRRHSGFPEVKTGFLRFLHGDAR